MRSPAAELLAALRIAFEELGLRWYLFGAQAVIAYAAPRLTADVDVTVSLGPHAPATLVAALEARGFRLRARDIDDFVRRTSVLPFAHDPSGLPVDVVLAGPGPPLLSARGGAAPPRARRRPYADSAIWRGARPATARTWRGAARQMATADSTLPAMQSQKVGA
jgi:hypothetical protein